MMRAYFGRDDIMDLKDSDVAEGMGLRWLEFSHLPDDESYLNVIGATTDLLSLEGDVVARMPQDLVDQFVHGRGPLTQEAARILAHEIPAIGRSAETSYRRWSGIE
jgi:hypothetical protein